MTQQPTSHKPNAMPLILIAEHDQALGTLIAEMLTMSGYRCRHVMLLGPLPLPSRTEPIQLLICRLGPGTTGGLDLEMVRRMQERLAPVPVLAYTPDLSYREMCPSLSGIAAILPMPFEMEELLATVARLTR